MQSIANNKHILGRDLALKNPQKNLPLVPYQQPALRKFHYSSSLESTEGSSIETTNKEGGSGSGSNSETSDTNKEGGFSSSSEAFLVG